MAPDYGPTDSDSRVYLLGLWRETTSGPWRATLRQAGSETRIAFADLEQLALFLLRLTDEHTWPGPATEAQATVEPTEGVCRIGPE
jgi:hypothetical protein